MPIDNRVVKAALESFEDDDFITSKNLLKGEIIKAKNDFIKSKLDLKNDVYPEEQLKTTETV